VLKRRIVLICCFLFFSKNLYAELIQWDAFDVGDKLAVKDVETGLIWLDLDLTAGVHYDDAGTLFAGWGYAGSSYVEALLQDVFPDISFSGELGEQSLFEQGCPGRVGGAEASDCYKTASTWQSLFGATEGTRYYQTHSYGHYKDAQGTLRMGGAYLNGSEKANRYGVDFNVDYSAGYNEKYLDNQFYYFSTFLVKSESLPMVSVRQLPFVTTQSLPSSVSEPTSKYFFALMLAGVWMVRRKQAS